MPRSAAELIEFRDQFFYVNSAGGQQLVHGCGGLAWRVAFGGEVGLDRDEHTNGVAVSSDGDGLVGGDEVGEPGSELADTHHLR